MMFEAMAFKFCPIPIKLSTSNFKLKKALSHEDSAFILPIPVINYSVSIFYV